MPFYKQTSRLRDFLGAGLPALLGVSGLLMSGGCIRPKIGGASQDSTLASEVDSFTPRTMDVDLAKSKKALLSIDDVTNTYLDEAIAWAGRQESCSGRCMALIVSETLASSGSAKIATEKLEQIRKGAPYRRWGAPPQFPGWRGYFGAIEPLISKGQTTDGRFKLDGGIVRLPLQESVFQGISYKDSPGSFLEVGAVLPYEMPRKPLSFRSGERLFIGSDKFGHFLSTGYEYLEAYLETYDETIAADLTPEQAEKRAVFATAVRGLLTESTILGGWTSRVFSFGDLAANYAGFVFFKDIVDGKSPYVVYDSSLKKWRRGPQKFTWVDFVSPAWDEGINCSHFLPSIIGDNDLQQKVIAHYVAYAKKTGKDLSCPAIQESCNEIVESYRKKFGPALSETLISPTCRETAGGLTRIKLTDADLRKDSDHYDRMGIYSGLTVKEQAKTWCRTQRDALVKERCESRTIEFGSMDLCMQKIKRVTSEGFRCELDTKDFAGWMF
jgi:hypothetical protein